MVITTGSDPILPPIEGANLQNVFPIKKDPIFLQSLEASIKEATDVMIIGGGFIGVEMAEQIKLNNNECCVTLVETLPELLLLACEQEFGRKIQEELENMGINIRTNCTVEKILGTNQVEAISLSTGENINANLVILGIGSAPKTNLAQKIGLSTDEKMGILVDEYMRTSDKNIFACGDCTTKFSALTGKPYPVRLASVAASEGMIVGSNLYGLNRKNRGVIGAFATKVGNKSVASAGCTEKMCLENKIDFYKGEITSPDRHPGSLPGCTPKTKVKLFFNKKTDKIIGGHILGGDQAADMVNILSLAIQQEITADELAVTQWATHPLLTGSPLVYQVMWAAENAILNRTK